MRKNIKRLACLLLSLTMIFSSSLFTLAVDYPNGVTKEMCETSSVKTDALVKNAANALSGKSLKTMVFRELYKNDTLNSLLTGIYSSLAQSSSTLSVVGIDISVKRLSEHLAAYPSVSQRLAQASDWDNVDLTGAEWNVRSATEFCNAAGAIFAPFNDVLYMLLCNGTYRSGIIMIPGDDGYEKGLVSMLSALGCTYIASADDFKSQASVNKNNMMSIIVMSILSCLDATLASPSEKLCTTIPNLADYIKNGGLEASVNALLKPLTIHIGDYFQLFTGSQMVSFIMFIQDPGKYTLKFSENITLVLNDMLKSSEITLPDIDLDALISCKNDKGGAYRLIMTWLIDAVKMNTDKVKELIPQEEGMEQVLSIAENFLKKGTDELFTFIVGLFVKKDGTPYEYQWASHEYTQAQAQYTENLGEREIGRVLDGIDSTINEFIVEMAGGEPLTDTIKNLVYSNDLITKLVKGVYGALSGEETKMIAGVLSLPTQPYELSHYLKESSLSSAKSTLSRYSDWNRINTVNWGFKDGNRDGFRTALTAALRPFRPVLEAFLANGTIEILGSINIGGSNGYNTAIIPILEALGCSSKKIKTYGNYEKGRGTDAIITDIIDPILDLVDSIAKKPIYKATQIVPNLLFFIDNGSLMQCIDNLIYPLTSLMNELSVDLKSFGFDLDEIKNTDILSKAGEAASTLVEGIDIGTPDLKKLIGFGELVQIKSKRTYNGERVEAEYVKADQNAVLVTILRYVIDLLGKEENSGLMDSFMGGSSDGSGGLFDQYSSGIGEQMANMTTDETLEWLYKLFFRERPIIQTPDEEYIPTVIYVQQTKKKQSKLPLVIFTMVLVCAAAFAFVRRDSIIDFFNEKRERKNNPNQITGNREG